MTLTEWEKSHVPREDACDALWDVLDLNSVAEACEVLKRLRDGRIAGWAYSHEGCGCLFGSFGFAKFPDWEKRAGNRCFVLDEMGGFGSEDGDISESLFMWIKRGDTPATNEFSALAAECIQQWLRDVHADILREGDGATVERKRDAGLIRHAHLDPEWKDELGWRSRGDFGCRFWQKETR